MFCEMKRLAILATTGAVLISAGLLIPRVAFADDDFVRGNMIEKLSEKLGLTESEVESVMVEIQTEERDAREAEREAVISEAFVSGDLTERQIELLTAMQENRPEPGEGRRGDGDEEGDHTRMLDLLNEEGLNVTVSELDDLRTVMEDLGFAMGPRRGEGMRRGR